MIKKYLSCLYSSFIKVYTQKNFLLFHHKYVKFFFYINLFILIGG